LDYLGINAAHKTLYDTSGGKMTGEKVGYIRVSSTDQNVDRQLDGLEFDNIFTDRVSGKSTERPALQEMMRHLRKGDRLYVHSMDRLARNLVDLRKMVAELTVKGVEIQFVKEGLTFTGGDSAMGMLMLSIMGAVAEFERSIIRERQAEGIKIAKTKGVYKGRKASLTYNQVEEVKLKVAAGIPKTKIAKEYKCNRETIYRYLRQGDEIGKSDRKIA
jgi:DNA invertase Pin-like site-specific DNA recombinase